MDFLTIAIADFNIPSNGVVFNNNDSVGTSQLLGSISANPNYNEGDAASIILVQVDGTAAIYSLLAGPLEVFGAVNNFLADNGTIAVTRIEIIS